MQYSLVVHKEAEADLEALWATDEAAAALVTVLLEELEGDQVLLDALTDHKFKRDTDPRFDVSRWESFWHQGKDLWRLRPYFEFGNGPSCRVIYAYLPKRRRYCVLAIVPRDFDYDPQHSITRRIIASYDLL